MPEHRLNDIDWTKFDENGETGYILEVDLDYPVQLHLEHSSLPLAPHRLNITEDILSPFQKECLRELRGTEKHRSTKLVSTFLPRKKYIVHAANLALYLELGMLLTKVHRALSFTQSTFLRQYIDYCTQSRARATTTFRKNLFKVCTVL